MCSVGVPGLFVDHLLGVSVIGSDEQDISGLFAGFEDRPDGPVGGRDGLDRRIQYTSVANLRPVCVNALSQTW